MPAIPARAAQPASSEDTIVFSPFVIRKTGLQQTQTLFKIDAYSLICVPYQSSKEEVSLLACLSKEEVVFFQRYKGALGGLTLVFQSGASQRPLNLFARCELQGVNPMKGRDNAALLSALYRPCPQDLARILGEYRHTLMRLKAEQGDYRGREVKITPEAAKAMGYNNYSVLAAPGAQHKAALYSVSSSEADILLPMRTPDMAPGTACSLKLYFQRYQFSVPCAVKGASRQASGVQRAKLELGFSPELVEILGNYFTQARLDRSMAAGK